MITLEDIHVTFARGTPLEMRALRGIDLAVPSGQFLTVIGSNGAGKSTALNVMAGGVRPDSGRVMIDDVDVTDRPIHSRARLVSRVFQDPKMGTCEDMTILENFAIAQGRTNPRGFRFAIDRALRKHVGERLGSLKLGLEHRLNDKVGLLSGGQRQAINLLMSTVGQTRVLLLDEHAAALDPRTGEFVMELTQDIVRSLALTWPRCATATERTMDRPRPVPSGDPARSDRRRIRPVRFSSDAARAAAVMACTGRSAPPGSRPPRRSVQPEPGRVVTASAARAEADGPGQARAPRSAGRPGSAACAGRPW